MKLEKGVDVLEKKVDDHEKRINLIESKFDFIKNKLEIITDGIKKLNPKKYIIWMFIIIGLAIGIIISGAINGV